MGKGGYQRLMQEIEGIPAIDSHEHLLPWGWTTEKGPDYSPTIRRMREGEEVNLSFLINNSYCGWERQEVILERWDSLGPFLDRIQARTFYRSLLRALQQIYNFNSPEIKENNWRALSRKINRANKEEDWQKEILRDKGNIDLIIWDQFWEMGNTLVDRELLRPVFRIDPFLIGCNRKMRSCDGISPYPYADRLNFKIKTFNDYLDFIAYSVEKNKKEGSVGIKCAIAYERSIDFQAVPKAEAESIFGLPEEDLSEKKKKAFGDYVMHFITEQATQHDLPIQIHTGLAMLAGSNPMNLLAFISGHPKAKFVLFHGGYPWTSQICAIAFTYHNVYLDLVWLPLLSPEVATRTLHEWIDMVDADRLTWGGDCWTAEEVYGALLTGREVICRVLGEKVEKEGLSEGAALKIARGILRDNALRLYNLE